MEIKYKIISVGVNGANVHVSMEHDCPVHKEGHMPGFSGPYYTKEEIIEAAEDVTRSMVAECLAKQEERQKYEARCKDAEVLTRKKLEESGLFRMQHKGTVVLKD